LGSKSELVFERVYFTVIGLLFLLFGAIAVLIAIALLREGSWWGLLALVPGLPLLTVSAGCLSVLVPPFHEWIATHEARLPLLRTGVAWRRRRQIQMAGVKGMEMRDVLALLVGGLFVVGVVGVGVLAHEFLYLPYQASQERDRVRSEVAYWTGYVERCEAIEKYRSRATVSELAWFDRECGRISACASTAARATTQPMSASDRSRFEQVCSPVAGVP
jgi:hypothetical protein